MSDHVPLWDVDHPYYCNEGNYFAGPYRCHAHYRSWQDFLEEQGDCDLDINLLFRWDWEDPIKDIAPDYPIEWKGDENYRDCVLKMFFIAQRKGYYRWVTVEVCRADEPNVRQWLHVRFDHLLKLWEPFTQSSQ